MNKLSMELHNVIPKESIIFWNKIKKAALETHGDEIEGTYKVALELWADNTIHPNMSYAEREKIANDIAMSTVVEKAIVKIAELTDAEKRELIKLNSEVNVFLLKELTKEALDPRLVGALIGGGLGAAEGGYEVYKEDKPLATIASRAIPGAAIGALAGHGYKELGDIKSQLASQAAESASLKAQLEAKAQREAELHTHKLQEIADKAGLKNQLEEKAKRELELHQHKLQEIAAKATAEMANKALEQAHANEHFSAMLNHATNNNPKLVPHLQNKAELIKQLIASGKKPHELYDMLAAQI